MSSQQNLNRKVIALFSGQSQMVTTPKLYIELTGSHTLAIILNQCVFWSNKSEVADGWFYKEYKDWFEEIHIPERTLRRRFDKLESMGWITTKIKKVRGLNIKHIRPNMDFIIESLSNMLDHNSPDRPHCPNGSKPDKNHCTKIAPTGQTGRLEPAKLADSSIYTEENIQKKLTTVTQDPTSSSFFTSKQSEELLSYKLQDDTREDELFLSHCQFHIEKQNNDLSKFQRMAGLKHILFKLNETREHFKAVGFDKKSASTNDESRIPTQDDFHSYKKCVPGFEWVGRWMQQRQTA